MARERSKLPTPPQGFVASAVRLPSPSRNDVGSRQGWQKQSWELYDQLAELRYPSNWIGNVMSRGVLKAAKQEGDRLHVLDQGPAFDALDELYGGPQGQSALLKSGGRDLTVGGEAFMIYRAKQDDWHTVATGSVNRKGGTKTKPGIITFDVGDGVEEKTARDLCIRLWDPHPVKPKDSDAPTRSLLTTMQQIVGYDQHISAQLTSRLAGNGILILPSEIDFPAPEGAPDEANQAQNFMAVLGEAMQEPVHDRSSPAALIPIVVTAPGDLIKHATHLKFWSDLDKSVIEMREAAVRRMAIGMDVPPEVLLGTNDANHWNAYLSEESGIKAHIEPRLGVMAAGLTVSYLRPALKGTPAEKDAHLYYVIADTAPIRAKPDRATEAIELHDRGLLKQAVTLKETGFDPDDAMDEKEYMRWLLQGIAKGAVTPELTAEALRLLGAPVTATGTATQEQPTSTKTDTEISDERVTAPDLNETRERNRRKVEDQVAAACEVLVYRALEKAGNRLKNVHNGDTATMAADTLYLTYTGEHDHLLDGAWDCAPKVLDGYDADVKEVIATLDFYVRGLLSTKRAHNRETMVRLLQNADVASA